jgi:hypothetical protein
VLEEAQDSEEIIQRVAALDIGKAQLTCCVRVPSPDPTQPGRRLQEVRTYQTMTRSLLVLADRLAELGVTRVVMEATSDYWKSPLSVRETPGQRGSVDLVETTFPSWWRGRAEPQPGSRWSARGNARRNDLGAGEDRRMLGGADKGGWSTSAQAVHPLTMV